MTQPTRTTLHRLGNLAPIHPQTKTKTFVIPAMAGLLSVANARTIVVLDGMQWLQGGWVVGGGKSRERQSRSIA